MRLKLKYVIEDVDRHGNVRVYYRPPGHSKIRMREKLGTPEFLRELEAAKAEVFKPSGKRRKRGAIVEGSLTHTANLYFASAEFERLDESTKAQRRTLMGKLCKKHGSKRVKQMLAPSCALDPRCLGKNAGNIEQHDQVPAGGHEVGAVP